MKFGKLAPKPHRKTLKATRYMAQVPAPPEKVYREYKIPPGMWEMFANDSLGDCTCAAIAHMLMLVTAHTGTMVVPTVDEVVKVYSAVSGYVPGDDSTDNGAAISDVLDYWQTQGISGHKILGWAAIDPTDIVAVKKAIWIFGGIDIGVNLPNIAMTQLNSGQPWDVVPDDGGIDGGHSVPNFGYGSQGTNCITWGQRQGMSWEWFAKYADEAYAVITQDWMDAQGKTPSGFDLATLQADLAALKQ